VNPIFQSGYIMKSHTGHQLCKVGFITPLTTIQIKTIRMNPCLNLPALDVS
jgi:hypothetical protein